MAPYCHPSFSLNTHSKWKSLFLHAQNNISYNIAVITLAILIYSFRKDVVLLLWRQNCPLAHSGTLVAETAFLLPACIASFPGIGNTSQSSYLSLWRTLNLLEKEKCLITEQSEMCWIPSKGFLMLFSHVTKPSHLWTLRSPIRLSNLCWSRGLPCD